jgi:hypothetical protein
VQDLHKHLQDYLHYNMITRANLEELRTKALKNSDADVLQWYLPNPTAEEEGVTEADLQKAKRQLEELLPCIGADSEYQSPEDLIHAMLAQLRRDEDAPVGCWGDARLRPEVLEAVHLAAKAHLDASSPAPSRETDSISETTPPSPAGSDAGDLGDHHLPSSELPAAGARDPRTATTTICTPPTSLAASCSKTDHSRVPVAPKADKRRSPLLSKGPPSLRPSGMRPVVALAAPPSVFRKPSRMQTAG